MCVENRSDTKEKPLKGIFIFRLCSACFECILETYHKCKICEELRHLFLLSALNITWKNLFTYFHLNFLVYELTCIFCAYCIYFNGVLAPKKTEGPITVKF